MQELDTLWYAKKEKYLHEISMFTSIKNFFFPDLPNLNTQIRCAQNRYTAVQNGPKIPPVTVESKHNYIEIHSLFYIT